jgi:flagellar biosynthesis anti-sigma factor FlgM
MRIGEGDQRPKYDPTVKKVGRNDKTSKFEQKTELSQPPDEVEISGTTQLLFKARKSMDDLPLVRVDKINPINKVIQNGSYEIKDKEVAEKVVQETLKDELL